MDEGIEGGTRRKNAGTEYERLGGSVLLEQSPLHCLPLGFSRYFLHQSTSPISPHSKLWPGIHRNKGPLLFLQWSFST